MLLKEILIMENKLVAQKKVLYHPETGEPIFKAHDRSYEWHPYQLEQHPELAHSFEFGQHKVPYERKDLSGTDNHLEFYKKAARAGFKDQFPTTISDDTTTLTVHHPENGKPISRFVVPLSDNPAPHKGWSDPVEYKYRKENPMIEPFRQHYDHMKAVFPHLVHDE